MAAPGEVSASLRGWYRRAGTAVAVPAQLRHTPDPEERVTSPGST